jgi:hypothetical protein
VGFFVTNALKRLDLGGGAPQTLASVVNGSGGTWSAEGVIVFASSVNTTHLMRVSAAGDAMTAVTAPDCWSGMDSRSLKATRWPVRCGRHWRCRAPAPC